MKTATLLLAVSALAAAETTLTEADLAAIAAASTPPSMPMSGPPRIRGRRRERRSC
jgi:hypothetical protein